mgnify:CR=1 FL=1
MYQLDEIKFFYFLLIIPIIIMVFVYNKYWKNRVIKNNFSNLKKREVVSLYEKILCLLKVFFIFTFNFNTHFKKYQHNKTLNDNINSKTFLKSIIYEQK